MGLDNGVTLSFKQDVFSKRKLEKFKKLGSFVYFNNIDTYEIDILYWRKCWNVRGEVFNFLRKEGYDIQDNDYIAEMDIKTTRRLIKYLRKYISDSKQWKEDYEDGTTIWESNDVYVEQLDTAVKYLNMLRFTNSSKYRLYFYDSY